MTNGEFNAYEYITVTSQWRVPCLALFMNGTLRKLVQFYLGF
jgi:hypothetical protein